MFRRVPVPPSSGLSTVRFELLDPQEGLTFLRNVGNCHGDVTEHLNVITDFCENFPPCMQGAMPVVAFEKPVGRLHAMISLCFRGFRG